MAGGGELLADYRGISVTGLVEALRVVPRSLGVMNRLLDAARSEKPQVLVVIDFPDFNFRLAAAVKKLGIPVVYYISPQLWAWRRNRMKVMKRIADRVLVIFPFEEALYREAGVPVEFVGHPLVDLARAQEPRESFLREIGLDGSRQIVALTQKGLVGLSPKDGAVLWQHEFKDLINESSTSPVLVGNLLIASSVTRGSVALKLTEKDGKPAVEEVWKRGELTCYFSTPVAVGKDHIYMVNGVLGLNPSITLRCVEAATGKTLWSKSRIGKYHASLIKTGDDKLLMLDDAGRLILFQADPKGYHELARSKVCGDTWATCDRRLPRRACAAREQGSLAGRTSRGVPRPGLPARLAQPAEGAAAVLAGAAGAASPVVRRNVRHISRTTAPKPMPSVAKGCQCSTHLERLTVHMPTMSPQPVPQVQAASAVPAHKHPCCPVSNPPLRLN